MSSNVLSVRQIGSYPQATPAPSDLALIQSSGLGGPYASTRVYDLVNGALSGSDPLTTNGQVFAQGIVLPAQATIGWGTDGLTPPPLGGGLSFSVAGGWRFSYMGASAAVDLMLLAPDGSLDLPFNTLTVARGPASPGEVVTLGYLQCCGVTSFNGRHGDIVLSSGDVYNALGLHGTVATEQWVQATICASLQAFQTSGQFVYSFNGRIGVVTLTADDITQAATAPGAQIHANSPALGDASSRIATTLFVDESLADLEQRLLGEIGPPDLSAYAPLASPNFSGIPTAPTANPGTSTGQLATTAFVQSAVTASTTGVASFNARTGAVLLTTLDVTNAGGAPIASPTFTGTPAAPTAATAVSTTQLATTAFVHAVVSALGAGVTSFNARTGAVTLTTADVTGAGGAPIASPNFSGTVTAPTPPPANNSTTVATTAYVTAAIGALSPTVNSFNGRAGAVTLINNDISAAGGALIASPTFTGVPSAPTAVNGTNTAQLATCAFVLSEIAALSAGVSSFNTRTGAVTLVTADITGAGGAPIASPALTGTPTAPTATGTSNDTTIATTAFVKAAITSAGGVTSFNSRTGVVTLSSADVSAAGGALIASPTFTGTPAGPTAAANTSTTQLATTQFVMNQLSTGAVTSFNARNGAVTLTSADITSAGGALLASPTFTGTPNAPTPTAGTNNTQIATTAFVQAVIAAGPYLPLTGGTLTGNLTITAGASSGIYLTKVGSTGNTFIDGQVGGQNRWTIQMPDTSAELGSNAGSNFTISSYSDTGVFLSAPLVINRASGVSTFSTTVQTTGIQDRAGSGGAYGGNVHNFNYSGGMQCWSGTTNLGVITFSSDYRIKKDIMNLSGMWQRVKRLRPVSYTLNDAFDGLFKSDNVERWGFVAHEMQDVLITDAANGCKDEPNVVQSPNPWTVLAALTKALQEAMERIEALEAAR